MFLGAMAAAACALCSETGETFPADTTMPPAETGRAFRAQDERAKRVVGIMYSVWHDAWAAKPHVTPDGMPRFHRPPYGAVRGTSHWWGVPAVCGSAAAIPRTYRFVGKDGKPNAALIDYHARLLLAAGVDFIYLDLTNGEQGFIYEAARALCTRYEQLVRAGQDVPRVVPWCSGPAATRHAYDTLIAPFDPRIFFRWEGRPLVLVRPGDPAPMPAQCSYRTMWGLGSDPTKWWSFKNVTLPYTGFEAAGGGGVEQMPVAFASQRGHMHNDLNPRLMEGRRGREGGKFFAECLAQVLRDRPRVMTVCSWNEWTSQNQTGLADKGAFVDVYGPEFSADCEPSVELGTRYYDALRDAVRRFKALP